MRLGIDFGTTRTVVAALDRGNYPIVTFEGDDGDALEYFPSLVAERAGELRFGLDAAQVARDPDWHVLRSFKRLLSGDGANGSVTIGSTTIAPGELLEQFLRALAAMLQKRSNAAKSLKRGVFDAVVAAPANAFCTQRFLTLDAFRRAGFTVRSLLNEPSAAGFEYAHRHARTITSTREHVVVYDLGGGTFDASLVRMSGTHHEVIATAGIAHLGGDDFDHALAELVLAEADLGTFAELGAIEGARLLDECRAAKESLTPSSRKVVVDLEAALGERAPARELAVGINDFYEAVTPLVERTLDAMAPLVGDDDELPADVAGIYVVGGASSLPLIGRLLRARFGRRVHRSPYPHAAVAIGLAIASDEPAGFELVDRFSRNFGVFREEQSGARASYDAIVTRDVALPRPGDPPVTIRRRYRAMHDIGHYRFFECSAFDESGNPRGDIAPLTDVLFPFVPQLRQCGDLAGRPVSRLAQEGPLVEERYAVDSAGIVEVTIKDLESGFEQTQRLVSNG